MADSPEDRQYRELIDRLVDGCRGGQGQVGADNVRRGAWNVNASADFLPDQHARNLFLAGLTMEHREIVAQMLADAHVGAAGHASLPSGITCCSEPGSA